MREIKFRAYDPIHKKMVYGIHLNYHEVEKTCKAVKPGYQWFQAGNTIYNSKIEQFTGKYDKNGKKIFEGDYLQTSNPRGIEDVIYKVEWSDFYNSFVITHGEYIENQLMDIEDDCEIIGNTTENPELEVQE